MTSSVNTSMISGVHQRSPFAVQVRKTNILVLNVNSKKLMSSPFCPQFLTLRQLHTLQMIKLEDKFHSYKSIQPQKFGPQTGLFPGKTTVFKGKSPCKSSLEIEFLSYKMDSRSHEGGGGFKVPTWFGHLFLQDFPKTSSRKPVHLKSFINPVENLTGN